MNGAFKHTSVLLEESIEALRIKPDGVYIDGTAGGAGHSAAIASRLTTGRLLALDKDPDAIAVIGERLRPFGERCLIVRADFRHLAEVAREFYLEPVDGILLDLGVSSYQLDTPERGFSYHYDAPLDMRMAKEGLSAYDVVNRWTPEALERILYDYGEERYARSIVQKIVEPRARHPIERTVELAELVKMGVPPKVRREAGHPARKTFQAIRIAVNGELDALGEALDEALDLLAPGGRIAVITFHSLEDRMVKQRFAAWCRGCECPPDFPVCVCGKKPRAKLVGRKPVTAGEAELEENPRSRSAKLRVAEKLDTASQTEDAAR